MVYVHLRRRDLQAAGSVATSSVVWWACAVASTKAIDSSDNPGRLEASVADLEVAISLSRRVARSSSSMR